MSTMCGSLLFGTSRWNCDRGVTLQRFLLFWSLLLAAIVAVPASAQRIRVGMRGRPQVAVQIPGRTVQRARLFRFRVITRKAQSRAKDSNPIPTRASRVERIRRTPAAERGLEFWADYSGALRSSEVKSLREFFRSDPNRRKKLLPPPLKVVPNHSRISMTVAAGSCSRSLAQRPRLQWI
jgi:hypothetical protein